MKDLTVSVLLDYYGVLLTEKQVTALTYYYNEDLSLGEISDLMGVSRQGVRDCIERGKTYLYELEEKLKLYARDTTFASQRTRCIEILGAILERRNIIAAPVIEAVREVLGIVEQMSTDNPE